MNAVHLLVEEWVDRQPDQCAVRDAVTNREVTYRQLWQHSGHLADQLQARGVERGDFVGLAMHRSVDLIVAMLGILRAGAAYLPLDAHAPADRIAMMLTEADVRLVVEAPGTGATGGRSPTGVAPTRGPDCDRSLAPANADDTSVSVSGDSPAYVAFTSGSTGRPKGVVVPHRAVVRLVTSPNYCTIAPGDRVANSSNPAFDATTFEVWNTLTAGGTLVVLPTVTDLPLDSWVDLIRAERITTMFLTTSLFHMVARERPTAFRTVDTLIVGGEQLELAAARRVLEQTAATAADQRLRPDRDHDVRHLVRVHGRQPGRTRARPDRLRAAEHEAARARRGPPPGRAGRAGRAVRRRSRRRTRLPAPSRSSPRRSSCRSRRSTVSRPGRCTAPETSYAQLPSGALELLGRRDRQIKLRGFRIELEEIERAAVETGLVDSAFVEKVGQGPSATLVGFVLPAESAPSQPADLSARLLAELAQRLPAYMIPARWNVLAELPLGPTGKVDRAALMAHVVNASQDVEAAGDDDDPALAGLRAIWQDVLGLAEIRDSENFIELGGNSILAVQTALPRPRPVGHRARAQRRASGPIPGRPGAARPRAGPASPPSTPTARSIPPPALRRCRWRRSGSGSCTSSPRTARSTTSRSSSACADGSTSARCNAR